MRPNVLQDHRSINPASTHMGPIRARLPRGGFACLCCALIAGCVTPAPDDASAEPNDGGSALVGNRSPVASAGDDQNARAGDLVVLDASATVDEDGDRLVFIWRQLIGQTVEIQSASSSRPRFVAPAVTTAQTFTFRVTVVDGIAATFDDVDVTVSP